MLDPQTVATVEALASLKPSHVVACPFTKAATMTTRKDAVVSDTAFEGTYAKTGSPPAAIKQLSGNLVVQGSSFRGLANDGLKLRGPASVIGNVFGEQWAGSGKPHCDNITLELVNGVVTIARNLFLRTAKGKPIGVNNVVRVEPNNRTDPVSTGDAYFDDNVIVSDYFQTLMFSCLWKHNFRPRFHIRRLGIRGLRASPALLTKLVYGGSHLAEWTDVFDLDGGGRIPVPPNVTVG